MLGTGEVLLGFEVMSRVMIVGGGGRGGGGRERGSAERPETKEKNRPKVKPACSLVIVQFL